MLFEISNGNSLQKCKHWLITIVSEKLLFIFYLSQMKEHINLFGLILG